MSTAFHMPIGFIYRSLLASRSGSWQLRMIVTPSVYIQRLMVLFWFTIVTIVTMNRWLVSIEPPAPKRRDRVVRLLVLPIQHMPHGWTKGFLKYTSYEECTMQIRREVSARVWSEPLTHLVTLFNFSISKQTVCATDPIISSNISKSYWSQLNT
jgi:hypothetical protein